MRIIDLLYEWRKREAEKHKREENVLWVTDLVRCPLKRVFEMKYPEVTYQSLITPSFIVGDFVHIGLEFLLGLYAEDVKAEVEKEKKLTIPKLITSLAEEKQNEYREVILRGRIDVLFENEKIGYEIKFSRSDSNIPHDHHKLQAAIYKWLFDLEKVYLIYITPDRITEFEVKERLADEEIIELARETLNCVKCPRYDWECKYCIFRGICNKVVK